MIIQAHQDANNGAYPETVAVTLWGLDTIKTKGESVGILISLVGATPIREGTGRIVGFELVPLQVCMYKYNLYVYYIYFCIYICIYFYVYINIIFARAFRTDRVYVAPTDIFYTVGAW